MSVARPPELPLRSVKFRKSIFGLVCHLILRRKPPKIICAPSLMLTNLIWPPAKIFSPKKFPIKSFESFIMLFLNFCLKTRTTLPILSVQKIRLLFTINYKNVPSPLCNQVNTYSAWFDFNAIALTETWLISSVSDHEIFVHKFSTYRTDLPSIAGGVLIAVNNNFFSELFPFANDGIGWL